jgi:hypothetical protein
MANGDDDVIAAPGIQGVTPPSGFDPNMFIRNYGQGPQSPQAPQGPQQPGGFDPGSFVQQRGGYTKDEPPAFSEGWGWLGTGIRAGGGAVQGAVLDPLEGGGQLVEQTGADLSPSVASMADPYDFLQQSAQMFGVHLPRGPAAQFVDWLKANHGVDLTPHGMRKHFADFADWVHAPGNFAGRAGELGGAIASAAYAPELTGLARGGQIANIAERALGVPGRLYRGSKATAELAGPSGVARELGLAEKSPSWLRRASRAAASGAGAAALQPVEDTKHFWLDKAGQVASGAALPVAGAHPPVAKAIRHVIAHKMMPGVAAGLHLLEHGATGLGEAGRLLRDAPEMQEAARRAFRAARKSQRSPRGVGAAAGQGIQALGGLHSQVEKDREQRNRPAFFKDAYGNVYAYPPRPPSPPSEE